MNNSAFIQDTITLIGRVFISLIFIIASIQKIITYHSLSAILVNAHFTSMPWILILSIFFELSGATLVFLGFYTRVGALLLFTFVLAATFLFHSFWSFQNPALIDHFPYLLRNISILGGLLYLMVHGAGGFSFDASLETRGQI